jgi:hypothetical protein
MRQRATLPEKLSSAGGTDRGGHGFYDFTSAKAFSRKGAKTQRKFKIKGPSGSWLLNFRVHFDRGRGKVVLCGFDFEFPLRLCAFARKRFS